MIDYRATAAAFGTRIGEPGIFQLDLDGQRGKTEAAYFDLDLAVADFFRVSGTVGVERVTRSATLSDGSAAQVRGLVLSAADLDAYAGLKGVAELKLDDVDFALALLDEVPTGRNWTGLQARAASASFEGLGGEVAVSGSNLDVEINLAASDNTTVDFLAAKDAGQNRGQGNSPCRLRRHSSRQRRPMSAPTATRSPASINQGLR